MSKERFQVGKTPVIKITRCDGDLVIRPWLELDVRAAGEFEVQQEESKLTFESSSDLILNVPEGAAVHVDQARHDVVIRSLSGAVSLVEVSGDVVISNVAGAKIGRVGGDLVARNVSGSLSVEGVSGDIVARNIDGDLSLADIAGDGVFQHISGSVSLVDVRGDINVRSVNGDLEVGAGGRDVNLQNLAGRCMVNKVAGDIRLKGGLGPYEHALTAAGDIVLIWPLEAPLLIEAEASTIANRLPLLDVAENDGTLSGRLGDGKTRLVVKAGGTVVLKEASMVSKRWKVDGENFFDFDFVSDLAEIGAAISSEMQHKVTKVTAELEKNFGPDFVSQMATQFSEKAGAAAGKFREAAERERTTQAGSKSQKQAADQRKGAAAPKAGSQEAQLKILKMVENGVITPDEAQMLLQALEGD